MLNPFTQISLDASSVIFVNPTAQGAQKIIVNLSLREPTLWAGAFRLAAGHIMIEPLTLTAVEIKEFFDRAASEWMKGKKR